MMKKLIGILLLGAGAAFAAAGESSKDIETQAAIKTRLESRFPGIQIEQVRAAPWGGLYEVVTAGELVYTTRDAAVVFSGNVVDVETRENLTRKRFNDLRAIDWKSLPLELAIKTTRGDGRRELAVFADPLCPFCQQLETQLAGVTNVTVYTFLYPLEAIHPGATEKARQIWCAADRGAAWTEWMVKRAPPPGNTDCDTKGLTAIRELGDRLKVDSTPTMYFRSGQRATGTVGNEQLERMLDVAGAAERKVSQNSAK